MAQVPGWTPESFATKPFDAALRAALDTELSQVQAVIDVIRTNLAVIQRDDTQLANGSVHVDALTQEVIDLFGGALTEHDKLVGLTDDDHPQYLLATGARQLTGLLRYASHPTFTANEQVVDKLYVDNAISGVGGITDHGAMDGLGDDDHPIYSLADGSRAFTAKVAYNSHPTFDADEQLIDKKYADDNFAGVLNEYVTETGASFTLGASHNGKTVLVNNASDVTVTAPSTGNEVGWSALLIPINTGRILLDDDGSATTFKKPATANLRSSEADLPIFLHQSSLAVYRVSGGLESAEIKRVELMVCGADVDVEATAGFNGNAFVIPDEFDGMDLVDVSLFNVGSAGSGGDSTYQVRNVTDSANMLSTAATIDAGETSTLTAAVPPVINGAADDVSEGDILRIDPSAVGTTKPKGLIAILEFRRPA